MKKIIWVVPFLLVAPLLAVSPVFWEIRTYDDFRKGTLSNLSLTNEDRLVLAPRFEPVFNTEQPFVWSAAADSKGNIYLGTGHDGKVFKVDSSGKGSQNFTAYFPHGIILQGPVTFGTVNTSTPATPLVTQGPRGTKIFAGPRQDPFVFDFVGFNRFLAGITPNFTGNDSFAGVNVMAIVVEMPLSMVVGNAQKFGFWGATFLQEDSPTQLTQIDRMGNPAINTALIPSFMKDAFNVGKPQNDATDFAPTILKTLAGFNTPPANVQILASVAVPDTLKFDVTKPDGFPNGRRLQDRVIDTELQLITGNPAVTDGTAAKQAAKVYLSTFPYLGPPCQASTLGVNAPGDCSPGSNVNPAAKPQPAVP